MHVVIRLHRRRGAIQGKDEHEQANGHPDGQVRHSKSSIEPPIRPLTRTEHGTFLARGEQNEAAGRNRQHHHGNPY